MLSRSFPTHRFSSPKKLAQRPIMIAAKTKALLLVEGRWAVKIGTQKDMNTIEEMKK